MLERAYFSQVLLAAVLLTHAAASAEDALVILAAQAGVRHTPQKRWPAGQRPPCRFANSSGKGHRAGKVLDNTQF